MVLIHHVFVQAVGKLTGCLKVHVDVSSQAAFYDEEETVILYKEG